MSFWMGAVIIICSCLVGGLIIEVLNHKERMAKINIEKDKQK